MTARFESKSGNVRGYISHEFYTENKKVLLEVPSLKYLLEKYYPGEEIILYGELYHDVYGNVVEDPLYNEYDCFVAKFRNEDWFQNRLNIYEEIWDNETGDISSGRQPIMSTDDVNMALSIQNGSMSARTSGLDWDDTIDYIRRMSFEDFSIPMYRSDAFEQTIKSSDVSFADFYPRSGKKDDVARLIKTPEEICFNGKLYKIIRGWLICSTNQFGSNHIPSEMTLYVSNGQESFWLTYYLWA